MPTVPRTPAAASPAGGARSAYWSRVDLVLAVVLTSVFGVLAGVLVVYGQVVTLLADPCGTPGRHCNFVVIDTASAVASLLPAVLFLAAIAAAVVQRRRHRFIHQIPAVGIAVSFVVFVLAALVVQTAVAGPH